MKTVRQFYDEQPEPKVGFPAFVQRLRKFNQRRGRRPMPDEAIGLMWTQAVVDRSVGILYRWTHLASGRAYIGVTTETLAERTRGHLRTLATGDYSPDGLHAAIARDGVEAFVVEELARFHDLDALAEAEIAAIAKHGSLAPAGFNLVEGGRGVSLRVLPIRYKGQSYKNLAALAEVFNLPVKRLESRLRLGWSLQDALTLPRGMKTAMTYARAFDAPVAVLARRHGLKPQLVHARIKDLGWTLEQALGIERKERVGGRAKTIEVAGLIFLSHAKAALHFGLPFSAWRKRIACGWTPEQAAGLAPPPPRGRNRIKDQSSLRASGTQY